MIVQSDNERQALEEGGRILATALQEVQEAVRPGVTTKQLDAIARTAIERADATPSFLGYQGYPAALCTSVNEQIVHGIPSERKLKAGDVIGLDLGVKHKGFFTDAAVTVAVGDAGKRGKAIRAAREALAVALKTVRAGVTIGDLGAAIQREIERQGCSVVRDLVGHGVGKAVHEEPSVPNFGKAGSGPKLVEGMVLAIEPMVSLGDFHTKTLDDGWTVVTADGSIAAHFEHTVIVTRKGCEILTRS